MFIFSRKKTSKEDRNAKLEELEKETVRKYKKEKKAEEKLSEKDKQILRRFRYIIAFLLLFMFILFFTNYFAGLGFSLAAAPVLYFGFRKKYPQQAILLAVMCLSTLLCFTSVIGGEKLSDVLKRKELEKKMTFNANIQNNYEYTQKIVEILFEEIKKQEFENLKKPLSEEEKHE